MWDLLARLLCSKVPTADSASAADSLLLQGISAAIAAWSCRQLQPLLGLAADQALYANTFWSRA